MRAKRKKGRKQYKLLFYGVVLMLLLLLIILVWWISSLSIFKGFSVVDRTEKIAQSQKKNKDGIKTVAWIRVQGTNIDYPVIYAPLYDFSYISSDFAWTEDDNKDLDYATRVYGHNIKNLSNKPLITNPNHSRFEQLLSYAYLEFAKKNQFIQYTKNNKDYVFRIFSVAYQESSALDIFSDYDDSDKKKLIKRSLDNSIYDFGVDVDLDDKLITLSTCTRVSTSEDINFVVTGRLLHEGEKKRLNKVTKTAKYDEIEKIRKGGVLDDEV